MVLLAFSVQDQIEKYGAYVSIACFLGLAVLSLLYFSQARELKRLREWAGRAPERARELEQRVVAQATATVARRTPAPPGAAAKPGAIAPPRRLAEMPAPQTAAGSQATELVEAVEQDEPATNGNVPAAPAEGEAAAPPANGAVAPGEAAAASPNGAAAPADAEPAEEGAEGAEAQPAEAAATDAPGGPDAPEVAPSAEADAPAAADAPAGTDAPEVAPSAEADAPAAADAPAGTDAPEVAPRAEADAPAGADAAEVAPEEPAPAPAAPVAGEVPSAGEVPRVTPAQRVGVAPRPAPMPLRQSKPSAVAGGRGGPRRPGAPAPRRGAARAPRERSGGTIALIVGLVVLILGGGTFLIAQLVGGDESPPPPNEAAPPPTQTAEPGSDGGDGGSAAQAAPRGETNVAVLNGTTFTGLAGRIADEVAQEGYVRGISETNTRDQTIEDSVVYYADGMRASAQQVARLLSIDQVEAIDSETQAIAPDADVVVLAGADQAP